MGNSSRQWIGNNKDVLLLKSLRGRLADRAAVKEVQELLKQRFGTFRIGLDLSEVVSISRPVMAVILDFHASFTRTGGGIKLLRANQDVQDVLLGRSKALDFYETAEDLAKSFDGKEPLSQRQS